MSKIVIIEDEEQLQKILQAKLQKLSHEVIIFDNGPQSLEYIGENQPDLVLLDAILPGGLDGFAILENLKTSESTQQIPVFILTNLGAEEQLHKMAKAEDLAIKANVTIDEVMERIKNLLSKNNN